MKIIRFSLLNFLDNPFNYLKWFHPVNPKSIYNTIEFFFFFKKLKKNHLKGNYAFKPMKHFSKEQKERLELFINNLQIENEHKSNFLKWVNYYTMDS